MMTCKNVIQTYCQALKDNDYQTIINLFSDDARVFSFQAGEKSPADFFNNLFANSRRVKVELKNILVDLDNEKTIAAYIYLDAVFGEFTLQFEAVDIFEFDSKNKIKTLRIILDTHPIRMLREKMQSQ